MDPCPAGAPALAQGTGRARVHERGVHSGLLWTLPHYRHCTFKAKYLRPTFPFRAEEGSMTAAQINAREKWPMRMLYPGYATHVDPTVAMPIAVYDQVGDYLPPGYAKMEKSVQCFSMDTHHLRRETFFHNFDNKGVEDFCRRPRQLKSPALTEQQRIGYDCSIFMCLSGGGGRVTNGGVFTSLNATCWQVPDADACWHLGYQMSATSMSHDSELQSCHLFDDRNNAGITQRIVPSQTATIGVLWCRWFTLLN